MEGEGDVTEPVTVWTVGHSTHPAERFAELLRAHGIEVLSDVRRFPTSKWPQFKQENLRSNLAAAGVEYVHIPELGGYRGDDVAHTRTDEFLRGVEQLLALGRTRRTAIMCAESMFFRCHRRFIADALVAEAHTVLHIFPEGRTRRHELRRLLKTYSGTAPDSGGAGTPTTSPRIARR